MVMKRLRLIILCTLTSLSSIMWAEQRVVKGKVTDEHGEPLIGAYVTAKGQRDAATATDAHGNYQLKVMPGNCQLEVTYVGFEPKKVTVKDSKDEIYCNVRLAEDQTTLDQVVVTATMTPKTLMEVPVVTRLINIDDIKKTDATNIQDMLTQELPGLEFGYAMSQETSLNMNGFGGNAVLFLVDGERLAGETMDNTDYNRLDLDNVGRIEIVKGASSALYGSNAVGGVINIISRESSEPWTANINSRYSSMGNEWRNGGSVSFNIKKWNSQTSYQQTKIDNINLPTDAPSALEQAQAILDGRELPATKSKLSRLYGNRNHNIKERLVFTPNEHLKFTARGGYFYRENYRDTYEYHFHGYSGGLKAVYDWKNGRNLEASYSYDKYDKANYQPDGTRTHDHDYNNTQNVVHLLYNQEFGKNVLTLGSDFMHDYLSTYQFLDNTEHEQNNWDIFAQFDYNPTKRLNFIGSVRHDYFSASQKQATTARLAAMYKWNKVSLRASYAGGFRAPTLKEMYMQFDMGNMGYIICGNPDLDPEKSNNFNLAFEHNGRLDNDNVFDGSYNITLMGYCNIFDKRVSSISKYWVEDEAYERGGYQVDYHDPSVSYDADKDSYSYVDANGVTRRALTSSLYSNEDGVTVTGADLSMQYKLKCGFGIKYSYAYTHTDGANIGSYFTQPRNHSMTWRVDYDHQFTDNYGFNIGLSGRMQGKPQKETEDADPGYTLWKLMLQQRICKGVKVNFTVDNLFNFIPKFYGYSSPMTTGRNYSVGASLDIDRLIKKKDEIQK
ncbi:MAG: TonB-dependent receptor [Paludibacteraceae bacterium]|nr:TonB-dependent receptor [Paludibacteraceae bacterium]